MTIQGKGCPHCNEEFLIIEPNIFNHAAKGGKMKCNNKKCNAEFWLFTPSDVIFLEAWGIAPEVKYDYVAVPT